MNRDGTGQINISRSRSRDEYPDWSPTEDRIIFVTSRFGGDEIVAVDGEGNGIRRIPSPHGRKAHPRWSPDGNRIAFILKTGDDSRLLVMNSDGTNATDLTTNNRQILTANWSPSGEQLVVAARFPGCDPCVCVIDSDGRNMTRVVGEPSTLPDW